MLRSTWTAVGSPFTGGRRPGSSLTNPDRILVILGYATIRSAGRLHFSPQQAERSEGGIRQLERHVGQLVVHRRTARTQSSSAGLCPLMIGRSGTAMPTALSPAMPTAYSSRPFMHRQRNGDRPRPTEATADGRSHRTISPVHHGTAPASLKNPAVGPSSARVARRTTISAPCWTVRGPLCPLRSVAT